MKTKALAALLLLAAAAAALVLVRRRPPAAPAAPAATVAKKKDLEPAPCGPPPAPALFAPAPKKDAAGCGDVAPVGADPFAKR